MTPLADLNVPNPTTDPAYQRALDEKRAELLAMPATQVRRDITLNPSATADLAGAGVRKLAPFRDEMAQQFGPDAAKEVDDLDLLARATKQAVIELARYSPVTDLAPVAKETMRLYRLLSTDAQSLVNRGLIDELKLVSTRDVKSYEGLIQSTLILVSVLRDEWSGINAFTPLTQSDLDNAERSAQRLATGIADRDESVNPAADLVDRAMSRLVDRYGQMRRRMTYLRWDFGDVDTIVPSLWGSRSRRSRGEDPIVTPEPGAPLNDEPTAPTPAPEPAPAPIPGGDPAPAGPALDPTAPGGPFTS